jgi:hypothetical protein
MYIDLSLGPARIGNKDILSGSVSTKSDKTTKGGSLVVNVLNGDKISSLSIESMILVVTEAFGISTQHRWLGPS